MFPCNYGSLRIGNETLRLLAIPVSPSDKEVDDELLRCSFVPPDAYIIGCHLPMSSSLCFFFLFFFSL